MTESTPSSLVKARWIAPYEAQMVDNTILVPGETVVEMSEHEALVSENWEIVGGGKSGGPTVADLRKQAKALGITIPSGSKKPDIEQLIAEHEAVPASEETPEDPVDDQGEASEETLEEND